MWYLLGNMLLLLCLLTLISNVRSMQNVTACPSETLEINCGAEEFIAIHQALFDDSDPNDDCFESANFQRQINVTEDNIRRFSVQSAINRRCSGLRNCSFNLDRDEPQAKNWGHGKVLVQYSCFTGKSYSCGGLLEIWSDFASAADGGNGSAVTPRPSWFPGPALLTGSGYLRNMGYPEYYRGPQECKWTVRATGGRRVRLVLLDLSIRSVLPGESACKDVLTVTENSRLLLNKCGDIEEPITVDSFENELNISLSVKSTFQAKRGLLAYLSGLGCPLPQAPNQSYLVYGNTSRAEFMCCAGHVFPDTGLRTRNLSCLDGHRWSEINVPGCIDVHHIIKSGNQSLIDILRQAHKNGLPDGVELGELFQGYDLTYDVILPTSIIVGLVLGNVIIILVVLYLRRQRSGLNAADREDVPLRLPSTEGNNGNESGHKNGGDTPV